LNDQVDNNQVSWIDELKTIIQEETIITEEEQAIPEHEETNNNIESIDDIQSDITTIDATTHISTFDPTTFIYDGKLKAEEIVLPRGHYIHSQLPQCHIHIRDYRGIPIGSFIHVLKAFRPKIGAQWIAYTFKVGHTLTETVHNKMLAEAPHIAAREMNFVQRESRIATQLKWKEDSVILALQTDEMKPRVAYLAEEVPIRADVRKAIHMINRPRKSLLLRPSQKRPRSDNDDE